MDFGLRNSDFGLRNAEWGMWNEDLYTEAVLSLSPAFSAESRGLASRESRTLVRSTADRKDLRL